MSRRDQIRMTDAEIDEFVHGRRVMNVATIGASGRPHVVAMWYGFLEGDLAFWTFGKSQKILNLRRDPRLTVLIEDGDEYAELIGVEIEATAELIEDHDQLMAIGASVMDRYTGPYTEEMRPILEATGAKRIGVRLKVDKIVSWDHKKLGGRY